MSIDTSSVVKKAIPTYGTLSEDGNSLLSAQSVEFVRFINDQAHTKAALDNRTEVTGEDIVWACKSFGLECYADSLEIFLEKYRESLSSAKEDSSQ